MPTFPKNLTFLDVKKRKHLPYNTGMNPISIKKNNNNKFKLPFLF